MSISTLTRNKKNFLYQHDSFYMYMYMYVFIYVFVAHTISYISSEGTTYIVLPQIKQCCLLCHIIYLIMHNICIVTMYMYVHSSLLLCVYVYMY